MNLELLCVFIVFNRIGNKDFGFYLIYSFL